MWQVWAQLTPPLKPGQVWKYGINAVAAKQVCRIIQPRIHRETIEKNLDFPTQRVLKKSKVNQSDTSDSKLLKLIQSISIIIQTRQIKKCVTQIKPNVTLGSDLGSLVE